MRVRHQNGRRSRLEWWVGADDEGDAVAARTAPKGALRDLGSPSGNPLVSIALAGDGAGMADETLDMTAAIDMRREYLAPGRHFAPIIISKDVGRMLGLVIAQWAFVENAIVQVAGSIVAESDHQAAFDKHPRYGNSVYLIRKVAPTIRFIVDDENTQIELLRLIDQSEALARERHTLVHGQYSFSFPAKSSTVHATATNTDKQGTSVFPLDDDNLQRLWHDMCHLTADLIIPIQKIGGVSNPPIVFSDDDLLAMFGKMPAGQDKGEA